MRARGCGLFGLAAVAMLTAFPPPPARAQDFPLRPLRLVVGFPQGGPNDILARIVGAGLAARLGVSVAVENLPGDSGNTATAAVVSAPADGYTLLLAGPANAINKSLFDKLPFDFLRDIAAVASIAREPLVLVAHPAVPVTGPAELIALAKAMPGRLKMASTGSGSSPHVSGLMFASMAGVEFDIVQFSGGGPALKGMIEGEAQVMFEPMSAAIEPVRAGKLRALAVTTAGRSRALPDVPALGEFVAGYETSAVTGIGAPAKTPAGIIEKLNREINAALLDPAMKTRLENIGSDVLAGAPADFAALMSAETQRWARVLKPNIPR